MNGLLIKEFAMKLPNLNIPRYVATAANLIGPKVNVRGDQLYFNIDFTNLPGNLGKYFTILGHFFHTHRYGIEDTPATVILDADVTCKNNSFLFDFKESLENTEFFSEANMNIFSTGFNCVISSSNYSLLEARSIVTNLFIDKILIPLEEILKGNEPILEKKITIQKHGRELFSFSSYWYETKIEFNIINNTDFRSEVIDRSIELFSKFNENYMNIYKDAYKLYDHFEKISYGSKNPAKEMVAIFDLIIVTSDCEELEINCENPIGSSDSNSSSNQTSTYGQIVLGNMYQNNIVGKGNISTKMLVEAAKKAEARKIQSQFVTYISQIKYQ
jgi:hypothetical protein